MRVADMPDWRDDQPSGLTDQERKHWNYQRYIKSYLRTIASVDRNVGRLLDWLDERGLSENTVVVYTSDNGFFLGEHGWFDKRFMYEESLRVPLLVRYPPAVEPGSTEDRFVLNLDFAETFLDYAGVPVPGDMQGRSLKPLLEGRPPANWRRSIYYHYYEYPRPHRVLPHYGVRTEGHKLIHYYNVGEWELFDLTMDPWELNDLYHAPAYAGVVAELKEELRRLRDHYGDRTGEPVG
jgi:arylsulfatase A-like enzyme